MKKTLWNSQILFNADDHSYVLDGEKLPSVTQIVRAVTGQDLSSVSPAVLKAAAERGNRIHRDVEAGAAETEEGAWVERQIDRPSCAFESIGYTEYSGVTFAGTADIVGKDTIFDVKSQAKEDRLYWTLQLNLYSLFFPQPHQLCVLHVPKSGRHMYRRVNIAYLTKKQLDKVFDCYKKGNTLPDDFLTGEKKLAPIQIDLKIYNQDVGVLTTNALDLQEVVRRRLAEYNAEFYSAENIHSAKKDKAELNRAAKTLNEKRLEIERAFMLPIAEFKSTINDTVDLIKKASEKIDVIVKEVDQREKETKKAMLVEFFYSLDFGLIDIEAIFNPKWLNKTTKVATAQKEIAERVDKIKSDLAVLARLGEEEARAYYLETLSLEKSIEKAESIKAAREKLAKEAEEEPADEPITPPPPVETEPANKTQLPDTGQGGVGEPSALEPTNAEPRYVVNFSVSGSKEVLVKLQEWMDSHGVEYSFYK